MVKIIKENLGWVIITVLSIIPFLIWFFMEPLAFRFENVGQFATSLGQVAGLTGMALFSIVIILSSRLKFFDDYLNGLNRVYINHHFLGGLAFSLLLFHPIFLTYRFLLISTSSAVSFLLPSLDTGPANFGKIALGIMLVLLFITFYLKFKYQIWKLSHKFLGLAFLFALLHIMLITSDISRNRFLRFYILTLAFLAILAFIRRTILGKYTVRKSDYIVDQVRIISEDVTEITLLAIKDPIKFNAGQFVFISFISDNIEKEVHPFTISAGENFDLRFTIKSLGDFTEKLNMLKIGTKVKVEGPFGKFNFKDCENKNQIWVAGGIGLTPFLSMARSLTDEDREYIIDFYYSVNKRNEVLFFDELKNIAERNGNFSIKFWVADENGFITAQKIANSSPNISKCDVFLCGPPAMMNSLRSQFVAIGIKNKNIHSEEFQL